MKISRYKVKMHEIQNDYRKMKFSNKKKKQFKIPLVYISKTPSETPKLAPKILTRRLVFSVCIGFATSMFPFPVVKHSTRQ